MTRSSLEDIRHSQVLKTLVVVLPLVCLLGFFAQNLWALPFVIGPYRLYTLAGEYYIFADMHCIVAACEGFRAGYDVFVDRPFDIFYRTHNYPIPWLLLTYLGVGFEHERLVAYLSIGAFLFSAFWVLRPRTWSIAVLSSLALCSPGIILGIERANSDLVVFCFVALALALLLREGGRSVIGAWFALFFATILKLYPAVAFVAFVRRCRDLRALLLVTGVTLAAGVAYTALIWPDLSRTNVPKAEMFLSFGGAVYFRHMGFQAEIADFLSIAGGGVILLGALWATLRTKTRLYFLSPKAAYGYLIGFSIILFCFFLRSGYDYRHVFSLFMFPLFGEILSRTELPRRFRLGFGLFVPVSLLVLLWSETVFIDLTLFTLNRHPSDHEILTFFKYRHAYSWFVLPGIVTLGLILVRDSLPPIPGLRPHPPRATAAAERA